MKIKGGINLDDADDPAKYEKADLGNAGRRKTNTQKDLDSMLFGGPAPKRRKPQEKIQQKKESESKMETKIVSHNQSTITVSKMSEKSVEVRAQPESSRLSLNSSKVSNSSNQVKKQETPKAKHQNFTSPKASSVTASIRHETFQKRQEIQMEIESEIQENLNEKLNNGGFNRPGFIRKFKKIAQNFNYFSQNSTHHKVDDVIKLIECERNRIIKRERQNYCDNQFPAISLSLGKQYKKQKSEWNRPEQVLKKPSFGKYIDPNDIQIGKMSSSKFVSILGCLAEKERNIKRLIENQGLSSTGFYYIRLNINGVWRYIPIDDFLPSMQGQNVGARSFNDGQSDLWAALIEKAYAKVFDSYSIFKSSIKPENYLRDLTGSTVKKYFISEQLHNAIGQSLQKNYSVIAVPNERIMNIGLNPGYCLSVLGMDGKGKIELRNSWGTITQRPKIAQSREGVFNLNLTECYTYIDYILVAQIDDTEYTSTIQSKHQNSFYSCYSFKVKHQSTKGCLSISQWDEQLFPSQLNYKYIPFRIIVEKKGENGKTSYVTSGYSFKKRNLDIEVSLGVGEYLVYCIGSWNKKIYDYNLTYRGKGFVEFNKVRMVNYPSIITGSLQALNMENGKRSSKGNIDEHILYHEESNLIVLTVKNVSNKPHSHIQDLSKINFSSLSLLNTANPNQKFNKMLKYEIDSIKQKEVEERKWEVSLAPDEKYTWIISTNEDYDHSNLRSWGFR